jgi:para-nitrobenzyl esterase
MSAPVIETKAGKVEGFVKTGVRHFLGIPYGGTTAGSRRFLPPEPVAPWPGVRLAVEYGPIAPQTGGLVGGAMSGLEAAGLFRSHPGLPGSEDCLVLNVFTPNPDNRLRPVMVWLHGGYFNSGYGSEQSDPKEISMVSRGDVVVVTINHRLGVHGFLHLGDLADERYGSSGMAGMLDLVLALEWVRDNAAAFGGDPGNVTIFGCSGGGRKTSLLMAMPAARGLFRRAIVESGPAVRALDRDEATARTRMLLSALGIDYARPLDLLDVPMDRLLETVAQLSARAAAGERTVADSRKGDPYGFGFVPVVDGWALPEQPYDPVASAVSLDVPLIIGTNRDEMALFLKLAPGAGSLDEQRLRSRIERMFGDDSDLLYKSYREWMPEAAPIDVLVAIQTAQIYRQASIRLAERKAAGPGPVYAYLFEWRAPILGGRLGACHGLEIPFAWGSTAQSQMTGGAEAEPLTTQMSRAWLEFGRHGDPNHSDLVAWPTYGPSRRTTMVFGTDTRVVEDPFSEERQLWEALL